LEQTLFLLLYALKVIVAQKLFFSLTRQLLVLGQLRVAARCVHTAQFDEARHDQDHSKRHQQNSPPVLLQQQQQN